MAALQSHEWLLWVGLVRSPSVGDREGDERVQSAIMGHSA
jgi:hypothetical protein